MARRSRLSAPTHPIWLIAVILGLLGILVHWHVIPALAPMRPYDFWLMTIGWALLVLGTVMRGL